MTDNIEIRQGIDGLWMILCFNFIVINCYYTLGPIRKSKLTFSMSGTQLQESVQHGSVCVSCFFCVLSEKHGTHREDP